MTAAKVRNLRLKFPGRPELQFRDLSLTIKHGEKVLLLGPSGCGKSTLLQVLTGLIPHSIEVPLKADEIQMPDRWGFVFQDPDTQFCMPYVDEELAFVFENLNVPREQMTERIDHYLELVGLDLPDRHTPIQSLSQGMKQRLAIAGVLALQPDVLFLDEPTALLDPEGTDQVWETIRRTAADRTLVIVEHKIDRIMDLVDRIVLFDAHGNIIADGPSEEIFTLYKEDMRQFGIWYPGVWEEYVNSPSFPRRDVSVADERTSLPLIELEHFQVLRGKRCVTAVDHAVLQRGDWVTIVGQNGAGKSTLLLGLMQLIQTTGSYRILGQSINRNTDLSAYLAFVFQNPEFQFVTNRTWDEIAYTLQVNGSEQPDEIAGKVDAMMHQFGLTEHHEQHPYQLSMGQKRRLSVASAIIKEQPILLLDEPTFGQDARNTFAIVEKLEEWRQRGTAIIMITHDLEVVRHFATQVWHVNNGKVDITEREAYLRLACADSTLHGDRALGDSADDSAHGDRALGDSAHGDRALGDSAHGATGSKQQTATEELELMKG